MIEISPRQHAIDAGGGVSLCYERFGDPADPPLVLVMGLGRQLIAWPEQLCEELSARGLHVLRFDNRDIGRSTHASFAPPRTSQLLTRRFVPEQYSLADMAADTVGLIDALELGPAHIVGVSMGGMIGQTIAARHPEHVRSLVSIMSTTGAAGVGWAAPSTLRLIFQRRPEDREEAARRAVVVWRNIGSPGFPFEEDSVRELASREFDRDRHAAAGTGRQLAAIVTSGDRTAELRGITAPTLVLHGDRDRMVHPSGGRATAAAILGARNTTIRGLGHDLPSGLLPKLIELIAGHAELADRVAARDCAAGGRSARTRRSRAVA